MNKKLVIQHLHKDIYSKLRHVMRKSVFGICENKGADELRGKRAADQRLCFPYTDSTILLLPKSENSSLLHFSVLVHPG